MPIYGMLRDAAFDPDAVKAMTTAYEDARGALALFDRNDPLTAILAKKIIEYAQYGVRDPIQLRTWS